MTSAVSVSAFVASSCQIGTTPPIATNHDPGSSKMTLTVNCSLAVPYTVSRDGDDEAPLLQGNDNRAVATVTY